MDQLCQRLEDGCASMDMRNDFDCCVLIFVQTAQSTRGPPDRVKSYLLVLFATRTSPYANRQAIQWRKPDPGRTSGRGWRVGSFRRFHARCSR